MSVFERSDDWQLSEGGGVHQRQVSVEQYYVSVKNPTYAASTVRSESNLCACFVYVLFKIKTLTNFANYTKLQHVFTVSSSLPTQCLTAQDGIQNAGQSPGPHRSETSYTVKHLTLVAVHLFT